MRVPPRALTFFCLSSSASRVSSFTARRGYLPVSTSKRQPQLFMSTSTGENKVRVALCQFKVTEEKKTNLQKCADFLDRAKDAELVVLPEIWNSPYATAAFPEYAEDLNESESTRLLIDKAKEHKYWIVGGSIPEIDGSKYYNTCQVINPDGNVVAQHRKAHLFDIDVPGGIRFKESDTLTAGDQVTSFTSPWGEVGLGICYDIRFPEYALLLRHCKILVYPGAFNMTTGPAHWELLQRARAVDNQSFVLLCSPARSEEPKLSKYPHYTAWGHSGVVTPWGTVVSQADETEQLVQTEIDLSLVDEMRTSIPTSGQRRTDLYDLTKS